MNALKILLSLGLATLLTTLVACQRGGGGAQSAPAAARGEAAAQNGPDAEGGPQGAAPGSGGPAAAQNTNVRVQVLEPQSIASESTYVGNLLPEDRIVVKSEIEGMVEALRFEESDSVKQGVTLANISTKEFQVRLEMAEADYRLARINFERDEQLSQRSLITQAQFDQSLARRDSARLAEQLADISLKKSIVRAPLKGAVKTKFVQLGEYVRKGDPIAEILDLSRIKVELNIPEREIIGLREGMQVDVESYAVKEIRLTGKITRIGLEADARNRSFPVEVTVNNSNNDLRPGMLARVTIRKASQDNQVVIPRNAIIERDNGRVVFLEDSGRAQQRLISTGISRSDRVQVVSGLAFGDRLIVEGHTKLTDGEPVNIR